MLSDQQLREAIQHLDYCVEIGADGCPQPEQHLEVYRELLAARAKLKAIREVPDKPVPDGWMDENIPGNAHGKAQYNAALAHCRVLAALGVQDA